MSEADIENMVLSHLRDMYGDNPDALALIEEHHDRGTVSNLITERLRRHVRTGQFDVTAIASGGFEEAMGESLDAFLDGITVSVTEAAHLPPLDR